MNLPSLDTLRCFEAAARLPSFRAAARALALTPAALGQRIKKLEDDLGTPLFARTTRSRALTAAGLALLPRARAALEAAADCVRAARGETNPPPIEITLGTRYELGLSFLLPQLPALCDAREGLSIHLYFGSSADLQLRIRSQEIDCAVTSTRLTDPLLDSLRLHREEYVLVAAPKLLARTPFATAAHAMHHTLVDAEADLPLFRYWRDAEGGGDRLRFARIFRIGTIEGIRQVVLAGSGVAVLPLYLVRADLERRRLRVLLPSVKPVSDHFRLVFRRDDPRRSIYEIMARTLLESPLT